MKIDPNLLEAKQSDIFVMLYSPVRLLCLLSLEDPMVLPGEYIRLIWYSACILGFWVCHCSISGQKWCIRMNN
jgi:hypothetical protein